MRSIFAAMIMLSAAAAAVLPAEAQNDTKIQPGYDSMQVPLGPPMEDDVMGADQAKSQENALALKIEQENERLDRELRGICRGC